MDNLPILTNYICGNINSDYSPKRGYYYEQYNYVSKLKIVCMWKQRRGYQLFLVRERQFAMINLLIFIKIKNIKIVFVQEFNVFR